MQKGQTVIFLLIGLIVLVAVTGGAYYFVKLQTIVNPQSMKKLSVMEIKEQLSKIEVVNKSKEFNSKGYPKTIGIDARNEEELFIGYSCMDICPQYGYLYLGYKKIKNALDCKNIQGEAVEAGVPLPQGTFNYCKPRIS